ncbi:type I-C CRISPR-associated protein Cas8c/Csd1 [Methylosinus sp. RM1]|uniref:type I-C CRISPR-associated protein Cas8c/Csd1 n=1 Tax=Methylosinus sp. RM1 TaxID=2583817 RepID=UPI001408D214|nr:type I-C CRISPR-associated protein Cas8c/Csd1 [Methylosinus sp. RM1]
MSMLAALVRRYERMAAKGEAPVPGYSSEKIAYGVTLAADGSVIDAVPLGELKKGKLVPESMIVPQPVKRTVGIAANLLWDKTSYVFGATDPAKESKRAAKKGLRPGAEEFGAFRQRQHKAIGETEDVGLKAFLAFLDGWDPQRYDELPHASDMLDANVVFRLDGGDWLHNRPAARKIVASSVGAGGASGLCLVTGQDATVARLHPSIKGVRGAQSSGAAIVSFNQSAFTSYGKEQGENAPVSEYAAFAYTTALNGLLAERRNRVQIGDATVVFWAEPQGEEEPYDAENVFAEIFGVSAETSAPESAPAPDAETQERDLLQKLAMIAEGRAVPGLSVDPATKFYVLGLSPNAARISVRFWLDTTIRQLAQRLTRHFEDLRLEPPAWRAGKAPNVRALIGHLAPMRIDRDGRLKIMFDDAPDHLSGEFVRAVLSGGDYPYAVLSTVLQRLKGDRVVTGLRVALVKAVLARRARRQKTQLGSEEADMTSDPFVESDGRKLGRLFAIYERAQAACFEELNSGVVDKFYASAMATPLYVFPSLDANFQHHLSKIRKGRDLAKWVKNPGALAGGLLKSVGELTSGICSYPKQLPLEEQGQFVIGYYQQKFGRDSESANGVQTAAASGRQSEEEQQ